MFRIACLDGCADKDAAIGEAGCDGLDGPTGTACHSRYVHFFQGFAFQGIFGIAQNAVVRTHGENKDIRCRIASVFHFGNEFLDVYLGYIVVTHLHFCCIGCGLPSSGNACKVS